jgi:ribonuclease HI
MGLRLAKDLGIQRLLIRGDSQMLAKQVHKEYDCNIDKGQISSRSVHDGEVLRRV